MFTPTICLLKHKFNHHIFTVEVNENVEQLQSDGAKLTKERGRGGMREGYLFNPLQGISFLKQHGKTCSWLVGQAMYHISIRDVNLFPHII